MIAVVTGYIEIPDHPRSAQEYDELGKQLLDCAFPVVMVNGELEMCWLYRYLKWRGEDCIHSTADNPLKNSLAYHIIQAQKTDWLAETALYIPDANVLVWIDYGIFHIPGVTQEIVESFVLRAMAEKAIAIPGCWEKGHEHDDAYPNWRFCGGVMVVPREHVVAFDYAVKREYIRRLSENNHVTWEVNVLAAVEQRNPELPIWWYGPCDHNATMFTSYRCGEHSLS